MPENAIYVGRPTRFGNPFLLRDYDRASVLAKYEAWLNEQLSNDPHFLDALRGKDLACFCRLDEACHADILLRKIKELTRVEMHQQMETESNGL